MKRIALMLAVSMILAAFGSGVAAADPINSKKAELLTVTCPNGRELTLVTVAPSNGNAGHIVGATGNIIATEITVTATDPDTGEVLYYETQPVVQGEKVGLHGDLITCTAELGTYYVPLLGQVATVSGTVDAFPHASGAVAPATVFE